MKTIKKYLAIVVDGEVKKKEAVEEKATRLSKAVPVEKVVMDTTALNLTNKAKSDLAVAKANKANEDIVIWEEIENRADNSNTKEGKKKKDAEKAAASSKGKTPPNEDDDEFDPATALKPALEKYAEDNKIDLGEKTKVDDIRPIIVDWHTENVVNK